MARSKKGVDTSKSTPVVPVKRRGKPKSSRTSPLTRRQELFVKELVSKDGQITLREAAINAGYPVSSAHTRAYEMTNPHICPHVVAAIQAYRAELDEKFGVTYEQRRGAESTRRGKATICPDHYRRYSRRKEQFPEPRQSAKQTYGE